MPNRLWDRIKAWVLLFVLMTTSLVFMLAENQPALRALRGSALEATAWVEGHFAWAGSFLTALDENERLRSENIQLASEVARAREARMENEQLRQMLGLRDTSDFPLAPARIVARDLTRQDNMLTLDVGRADSVREGMPVVDERGIIGKVVLVSEHYSRVMPYLNTNFRVPAQILPSRATGIVGWEGNRVDQLIMEHVPKTETVLPGQLVITSGSSGVFPSGYPLGFVDSVAVSPGRNEQRVMVQPMAPLYSASHAFVILRTFDEERRQLESRDFRTVPGPALGGQ